MNGELRNAFQEAAGLLPILVGRRLDLAGFLFDGGESALAALEVFLLPLDRRELVVTLARPRVDLRLAGIEVAFAAVGFFLARQGLFLGGCEDALGVRFGFAAGFLDDTLSRAFRFLSRLGRDATRREQRANDEEHRREHANDHGDLTRHVRSLPFPTPANGKKAARAGAGAERTGRGSARPWKERSVPPREPCESGQLNQVNQGGTLQTP